MTTFALCLSREEIIRVTSFKQAKVTPGPSQADLRLIRRIGEGARILQIQFLDHVIIGQPMNGRLGYFSFKEAGTIA